jgi:hypothetical protein
MKETTDMKGNVKTKEIVIDMKDEDKDPDLIRILNPPQKAVVVVMTERKRKTEKDVQEADLVD